MFIKHDLNLGIPEGIKIADAIIHLASSSPHLEESGEEASLNSLLTNAFSTRNLLEFAKDNEARFLLVSSINVYQGVISSLNLKNYFGPTPQTEKRFSHIEAKRFAEALVWEYSKKYGLDARIVRVGEVYGPKIRLAGPLGDVIKNVAEDGLINIKGDGIEKEYYVFVKDAAEGIVKALFLKDTKGKIFPLCYEKPASLIELSYVIKSISTKEIKINFDKRDYRIEIPEIKNIARENLSIIKWGPKVNMEEGIRQTLLCNNYKDIKGESLVSIKLSDNEPSKIYTPPLSEVIKEDRVKIKINFSKLKWILMLFFGLFIVNFILIPSLYFASFYAASIYLVKSGRSLNSFDIKSADSFAKKASFFAEISARQPFVVSTVLHAAGKDDFKDSLTHKLNAIRYYTSFISLIAPPINTLNTTFLALGPNSRVQGIKVSEFKEKVLEVSKAKEFLLLTKAELGASNLSFQGLLDIDNEINTLDNLESILPVLSSILGYDKEQTYLILFQDSNELRPSGGVIASVAKLKLKNGKITDTVVYDASNIDEMLNNKNDTTSSDPMVKNYLGDEYLRFSNVNWDADFSESAVKIISLYKNATNEDIDGVFAVDLFFVKDALSLTGPIFLSYYNQNITQDNLFEKALYYSDYSLNPSGSKSKGFISSLAYKILDAPFSQGNVSDTGYSLYSLLNSNFSKKHVLFYHTNPEVKNALYKVNWAGILLPYTENFMYVLDSNIGLTKADLYINRSISYRLIKNEPENFIFEVSINYKHTGTSNAWPSGVYKNFLRLYIPEGSELIDAVQSGKISVNITKDVAVYLENGRAVMGVLTQAGAGESVFITLTYSVPKTHLNKQDDKGINIIVQKQPGTENTAFSFVGPETFSSILEKDLKIDILNIKP